MNAIWQWGKDHEALLFWLAVFSVLSLLVTIITGPIILVRLPADYFVNDDAALTHWGTRHAALRVIVLIVRNILGYVFILAGIAMLVLPGQGVVTILIGLILVDFPRKKRLLRWLFRRPPVHRTINWLRRKTHHEPLKVPS
ncbi:MAG: hypothetical protein GC162_18930 [Planctomycetes bacterium]|nr:hypothetical protein [Planctomycetota bacterium]